MPVDPDATPVEGIGNLKLLADKTSGSEDETQTACPRCEGRKFLELRTETVTGYSVRRADCWLCVGTGFVTLRVFAEWMRIQKQ
jgi:hypothetical protein